MCSPLPASCARGHTSVTFSSRRPSKPLVHLTGCAGANRRRPGPFSRGHCANGDGWRNCSSGTPCFRGLPRSRHSRRSSVANGGPAEWTGAARHVHLGRYALGRRRFTPPGRSRSRAAHPSQTSNRRVTSSPTHRSSFTRGPAGRRLILQLVRLGVLVCVQPGRPFKTTSWSMRTCLRRRFFRRLPYHYTGR